jgi:hypothetical protein
MLYQLSYPGAAGAQGPCERRVIVSQRSAVHPLRGICPHGQVTENQRLFASVKHGPPRRRTFRPHPEEPRACAAPRRMAASASGADPSRRGQAAAPQDEGGKTVIARSSCDEAIQPFRPAFRASGLLRASGGAARHPMARNDGRAIQFSTLIFASRITGPHLSISDCRNDASSAGVEPFGLAPSSSNRDFTGA